MPLNAAAAAAAAAVPVQAADMLGEGQQASDSLRTGKPSCDVHESCEPDYQDAFSILQPGVQSGVHGMMQSA